MSGDERRFFSGASLAQALMAASRHFHVPPEELSFRLREKRHGFTHKTRAVVIEVDPKAPARAAVSVDAGSPSAPRLRDHGGVGAKAVSTSRGEARVEAGRGRRSVGEARREGGERRVARADESHVAVVREAAAAGARLGGLDLALDVAVVSEEVRVELRGPDAEWLAGRGLETLEALEDVIRRASRGVDGAAIPVVLDPLGLRGEREGELRSLALAAAAAVRKTGRPIDLDPLPAAERRVIHLVLADCGDLVTESRGEGRERRIEIRLRAAEPGESPQIP